MVLDDENYEFVQDLNPIIVPVFIEKANNLKESNKNYIQSQDEGINIYIIYSSYRYYEIMSDSTCEILSKKCSG